MADAMATAMMVSAVTDVIFRIMANKEGMTPEELKAEVDALQLKADDLEAWLKSE